MSVETTNGIKSIVNEINELFGKHIVTVKLINNKWRSLGGESLYVMRETGKAVFFLEGLKRGIQVSKGNI